LADQPKDNTIPLKTGDRVDAKFGRYLLSEFRELLEEDPSHLGLLRDLVEPGLPVGRRREILDKLQLTHYAPEAGELLPAVRAVFAAAVHETRETKAGPVVNEGEVFKPQTAAEWLAFFDAEPRKGWLKRLAREVGLGPRKGEDRSPG
jgi:hypothetical protein